MNDNFKKYGIYLLAPGNLWGSQVGNEISNIESGQKAQQEDEKLFSDTESSKILIWWQLHITVFPR